MVLMGGGEGFITVFLCREESGRKDEGRKEQVGKDKMSYLTYQDSPVFVVVGLVSYQYLSWPAKSWKGGYVITAFASLCTLVAGQFRTTSLLCYPTAYPQRGFFLSLALFIP